MIAQTKWFDRKFNFDFPAGFFPCLLERFRGTPARLEESVRSLPREVATTRQGERWSIQEHAGHLLDLSSLDEKRLRDFLSGSNVLTAADLNNRATYEANHNANTMESILYEFRRTRLDLVRRLAQLTEEDVTRSALHPRLNQPMRLVDWLYFMCEHDDHHLARIASLKETLSGKQ